MSAALTAPPLDKPGRAFDAPRELMGLLLDVVGPAASEGSAIVSLLQALLALVLVGLAAWLSLRFLAGRGFGRGSGKLVQVEERVMLDPRNGLLVVRIEDRRLLLATHADAPARLLVELEAGSPDAERGASQATAPAVHRELS